MKKSDISTNLTNPNDPSPGQCYAPVENGVANKQKKRHIPKGENQPLGWVQVSCDNHCRK